MKQVIKMHELSKAEVVTHILHHVIGYDNERNQERYTLTRYESGMITFERVKLNNHDQRIESQDADSNLITGMEWDWGYIRTESGSYQYRNKQEIRLSLDE